MIKEFKEEPEITSKDASLKELSCFLNELLFEHPELSDMTVAVATACGYCGAGIATPLTAVLVGEKVQIMTDDDGRFGDNPTFYREVKE